MTGFSLATIWQIPAPVDKVWEVVIDTENWPQWWKYVENVEELDSGDVSGINNLRRYYWSTSLPYQLVMDLSITRLEPCRLIETRVSGDLKGKGSCKFTAEGDLTVLRYQWNVELCKPWMNKLAPIAYPVFAWNHQQVMKQGEINLIQRLEEFSK